ncbi:MAG TPA: phosphatase PAP2 family protein [Acidimicrobiales bacterium]
MTRVPLTDLPDTTPETERPRPAFLRWWKEVIYIVVFYVVYSAVRNNFGSAAVEPEVAFRNAERIIDLEKAVGLYVEEGIQDFFLDATWFIRFWNIFYGTAHFAVTIGVMVFLFRKVPYRYPRWRNALAWTTALALVGFATFPLMPPRLLPPSFGYVDTLDTIGGLWSFSSGAMAEISNQYAAMPSLHIGWSMWSALAMVGHLDGWARRLMWMYPVITLFAIVVTGNHYWLDAVGGAAALGLGYIIGSAQDEWRIERAQKKAGAAFRASAFDPPKPWNPPPADD